MNACPLCQHPAPSRFLHRAQVPVHQNLLCASERAALSLARGELDMRACAHCGFVYNAAFDPALLSYGADYENNQAHSSAFKDHLDALIRYLLEDCGIRNQTIVEVGCGQGDFLHQLVRPDNGNRGYGFDPSYRGPDSEDGGRLHFETRYYDGSCSNIRADVVICRHVIEHVPSPISLLRAVHDALRASPQARVFFETPCVEWILRNQVIWDFFYEHCSLFSPQSLSYAFRQSGFRPVKLHHVFGGQYLFIEAVLEPDPISGKPEAGTVPALASAYARIEEQLIRQWQRRIEILHAQGGLALWGAGAKGVTFASLMDPQRRLINSLVDLNPAKQGHYVAGTGHPIIAYTDLRERGILNAILMNPNYLDENQRLLKQAGLDDISLHVE